MKKFFIGLLLISLGQISVAKVSAAQDGRTGVEQAFTAVQQSIDNLITAKDQNNSNDLSLRLAAFKKVIELSVSEAKDLKVKLLSAETDENKDIQTWQKNMAAALDKALNYYDEQSQNLDQMSNLDLTTIKNLASDFKAWRDLNYLPIADQITSFVLIQQEKNAIAIAEKRAQKIGNDIKKLPKIKNFNPGAMLVNAKQYISEGKNLNGQAYQLFLNQFIEISSGTPPQAAAPNAASSTATSSIDMGNLTPVTLSPNNASSTEDKNASSTTVSTSTAPNATSTEVSPPPPPSIKDLIKASLDKIKDAYQTFIEMSNLVRKLLS